MIYFDNASTTHIKPESVINKIHDYLTYGNANPGRSAHELSIKASRMVFEARERLAKFFNLADSKKMIFTSSATDSINMVINGVLSPSDHVIVSSLEHNAKTDWLFLTRQ